MLYICGTPIGNIKDITLRQLDVLKSVDTILAEDTRNTIKLLNHYDIKSKLVAYHKYNEKSSADKILAWLKEGKDIALVSDAGMPGISDPGNELVKLCVENNIPYTSVPSATALTTAVSLAGIDTPYAFLGFLPTKQKEQKELLEKQNNTFIFYEAPHRLIKTLTNIKTILGERNVIIARELTKKFEEIKTGNISEIIEYYSKPKGEFVVIIQAGEEKSPDIDILSLAKEYLDEGFTKKEIIKIVAIQTRLPRNEIYSKIMQM